MVWGRSPAAPHGTAARSCLYARNMDFERHGQAELGPLRAAELAAAGEALIVDVRQPFEWEESRVPGARLIPLEQLPGMAAQIDDGRPVIFLCRSGNRSAMATEAFLASGRTAYNLSGGILAWIESGLEIQSGELTGPAD